MQVTVMPESTGARPLFPRDEEARVAFNDYVIVIEEL